MPPPLRLNPQYLWNALHMNRVTQTVRSLSTISDLFYVLTCCLLDLPVLKRIQRPFAISQRSFVHYLTVSLCSFALDDNSTHTALQQLAAEHACPSTTSFKISGLHAGTTLGNDAYVASVRRRRGCQWSSCRESSTDLLYPLCSITQTVHSRLRCLVFPIY